MREKARYFLIYKNLVGKVNHDGYYIFQGGTWIDDKDSIILDHLYGYDPSEPSDSPYGIGNTSIMEEMVEITEEKALELTTIENKNN